MHKVLVLILIITSLTGCSIMKIDSNKIETVIDQILLNDLNLYNRVSKGYKYYLPRGVRVLDYKKYNEKLFANKAVYYMYIDITSYFYNRKEKYTINDEAYLSLELTYNNGGYAEINQINDKYFIEMMYNYAKIEAYVDKNNIEETLINMSYILSSIKYNYNVIKIMFDEDLLDYKEEKFNIFEPKRKEGNFLDYINEYDIYEEPEEDVLFNEWIIIE